MDHGSVQPLLPALVWNHMAAVSWECVSMLHSIRTAAEHGMSARRGWPHACGGKSTGVDVTVDREKPAHLVLHDGNTFSGRSFGAEAEASGEVVFCTGLVGYPESLTDPSYRGQILVFTYPLIGNYGVPDRSRTAGVLDHFESERIQVSGVIVSQVSTSPSHWTSVTSLHNWLASEGVPGIEQVDTRRLTQILRSEGVMPGRIAP